MGAGRQIRRAILDALDGFKSIFKKKQKFSKTKTKSNNSTKTPKSWAAQKPESRSMKDDSVKHIDQQKMRLPGYRVIKRGTAALLLMLNFIFSIYLLGTGGRTNGVIFMFFMANSFIVGDYLWKSREKRHQ